MISIVPVLARERRTLPQPWSAVAAGNAKDRHAHKRYRTLWECEPERSDYKRQALLPATVELARALALFTLVLSSETMWFREYLNVFPSVLPWKNLPARHPAAQLKAGCREA